ncbi:kinase-like domain-containing protein, partial [Piptocephalis cylindrospora]
MGNVPGKVDFSEEVNLSQFNLLRSVGRGSFGKVRIVERKDTKRLFALKYISKKDCIRMDALRNVFRERNILEAVDHPFICNLRFAFQDDDYMYMALDLMLGGDLRFHLLRKPYFSEDAVRMWISEIACAVSYLHGKGIVHRDIKPDNILLDEYGHAHLTDFNIATHAERSRPLTSESGTYVYMAPEMLTRKGYLHSVDWWALGVVFYECIYGKRPFDGATNEELRYSIAKKTIRLSQKGRKGRTISSACLSAIDDLLQRDASRRLVWEEGQRGLAGIQAHPFFADLDWYRLERKELQPAYVPDSNAANFDVAYDLEELLLEQQPLEAKPRKK